MNGLLHYRVINCLNWLVILHIFNDKTVIDMVNKYKTISKNNKKNEQHVICHGKISEATWATPKLESSIV